MSLKTFFKIGDANAEVARLSTELTNVQASLDQLKGTHATELATAQNRVAELETNLSTVTGERDSARTELNTARTELATAQARVAELEGKQTTVETRAAELAATVGTPKTVPAENDKEAGKSREQLWSEYHALKTPEEQRAFWIKNKPAMR
jgi:chromosome segregation ATPase